MDPADQRRVEDLFRAAGALPIDRRRVYLEAECPDDPAVRAEVLELLEQERLADDEGFLESDRPPQGPCQRTARAACAEANPDAEPGRIGSTTRVRVILGAGPHPTMDLVPLLRKFLRAAASIASLVYAVTFLVDLRNARYPDGLHSPFLLAHLAVVLISGIASAIVFSRRHLTEPRLRAIEYLLLATNVGFLSLYEAHEFIDRGSWPPGTDELQTDYLALSADSCVLRWFALIVIYGIFSPNTGWRCARNTIAVALVPLVVAVGASLGDPEPWRFKESLVDMGIFLALSCATAICGSFKIARLREAEQASRVGEFRLARRLGSGGMGEVYLAFQPFLSRPCALKLIRAERSGDLATVEQFHREVRQASRLMHRNNIRIYYSGVTEEGTLYYTMEYLAGLTFQQLVEAHGPLPPARVVYMLRQVCLALREAHAQHMLHRDIKPGNLMLCLLGGEPDVVKVLDYGLVQELSRSAGAGATRSGTAAGTPAYMSTEQLAGRTPTDVRSDVYSVGAVGFFLLTGRAPGEGGSVIDLLRELEHRWPPRSCAVGPEIPGDLDAVLTRCLDHEPDRRFTDVISLEEALGSCEVAGRWDAAQAARWWRENPVDDLSNPARLPAMAGGGG